MAWRFGRLGCLTKLCLGSGYGDLGMRSRLWKQVIASKYGEASGGWCTRVVRGTYGCGMWKNIRKGAEIFFGHVLYATDEDFCIRFWHDP